MITNGNIVIGGMLTAGIVALTVRDILIHGWLIGLLLFAGFLLIPLAIAVALIMSKYPPPPPRRRRMLTVVEPDDTNDTKYL
jgi:hypothetical protein